jgi:hypothetical protein
MLLGELPGETGRRSTVRGRSERGKGARGLAAEERRGDEFLGVGKEMLARGRVHNGRKSAGTAAQRRLQDTRTDGGFSLNLNIKVERLY